MNKFYSCCLILEIAADISATDFATKFQRDLRSGELSVKRSGTCSGYYWDLEWIAIGGNKPELVADGSLLSGDSVTISVTTSQDGGVLMGPIPGEFLRLPEDKPQVSKQKFLAVVESRHIYYGFGSKPSYVTQSY